MKYIAIVTYGGMYNDFVSPFCESVQAVEDWCKANSRKFEAIHPVRNWQEIVEYRKQKGEVIEVL